MAQAKGIKNNGGGNLGQGRQRKVAPSQGTQPSSSNGATGTGHGRKPTSRIIDEATQAYHASSSKEVKKLIAVWEEEIWQTVEDFDLDLDEWKAVTPDPGHTRGIFT